MHRNLLTCGHRWASVPRTLSYMRHCHVTPASIWCDVHKSSFRIRPPRLVPAHAITTLTFVDQVSYLQCVQSDGFRPPPTPCEALCIFLPEPVSPPILRRQKKSILHRALICLHWSRVFYLLVSQLVDNHASRIHKYAVNNRLRLRATWKCYKAGPMPMLRASWSL